ncbi:uncharacterized protein LOC128388145 isoform X2 [Panonychus citri]|uniref:uncharacterized protein LOC128388145 isoform X2 n=1 Tax=Panonychus citri TaxID=50023 RepID=UPI0023070B63|nr:uncharacterized protein LOC128388145 isoform X2 [Panonychus citri]
MATILRFTFARICLEKETNSKILVQQANIDTENYTARKDSTWRTTNDAPTVPATSPHTSSIQCTDSASNGGHEWSTTTPRTANADSAKASTNQSGSGGVGTQSQPEPMNKVMQQLIAMLESPTSQHERRTVISILQSNPKLMAAFLKQRQASSQSSQNQAQNQLFQHLNKFHLNHHHNHHNNNNNLGLID